MKYEELEPRELQVSGTIPVYCAGTLYRNGVGPAEFTTDKKTIYRTNHWFDCLSQVHRFQILPPSSESGKVRVIHNSRRTCDGLVERVMRTGKRDGYTFAAKYDPCQSFFKKLQSLFSPTPTDTANSINVSVTLSPNFPGLSKTGGQKQKAHESGQIATLINKSDNSMMQALDPETLEPIGMARQSVLHPDLKGSVSGAHAKVCPKTGDIYNFNLDFGKTGCYRAFHVSASTGRCSVLATFPSVPAYLHSSFLTENYYIVCVWNSHFSAGGVSILWTKNFLDALSDYDPKKPATWYVVDRKPVAEGGRGLVATFESDPFFCFHTINAYEERSTSDPDQIDIIADLCAYDSLDVLKRFYVDNLRSDSASAKAYSDPKYDSAKAYFRRFKLPAADSLKATISGGGPKRKNSKTTVAPKVKQAENISRGSKGLAPELPSINHAIRGTKYRYVYGVTDTGKSTFFDGIVKYNVQTNRTDAVWSEFGQSAGEPIFVADPSADPTDVEQEDNGVLLTAVLDGPNERSYLLVLNAKDLTELGRATMVDGPAPIIGFGFHGAHVRDATILDGA